MTDPVVREIPPFAVVWEMQIKAVFPRTREKGIQAWFSHLGKAVSFRCCLLHFLEVFVFESPAQVHSGFEPFFICDVLIQESSFGI